jgi:putative transposase
MPFEAFSQGRLDALLLAHPITAQGMEFIEKALAAPSRNVQGSTRNVVSDLPCPKMRGNAQAESWSAENPFTIEKIFNPDVVAYTNQVPAIELLYKGRNGRTVRAPYTGDCLSFTSSHGVVLEEWKSSGDRDKLEEKYPGKYQRLESGEYTSIPISNIVNPWGIKFVVRFSDELTSTAIRNRRFLYHYLQPSAAQAYDSKLRPLLLMFDDIQCRSYVDLIESGADTDVLNWAIAYGHLHIDFDVAAITAEPSRVLVFRHAETLKAWKLAARPGGSRPTSNINPSEALHIGDIFIFDGRRLRVTMDGLTAIYAVDDHQNFVTIELPLLMSAYRDGKVILPTPPPSDGSSRRFWSASPRSLGQAVRRIEILERRKRGEALGIEDQYSPSTFRRWQKAMRDGEAEGLSPVEALLDLSDDKGFSGSHIDLQLSADLDVWIEEALSNEKDSSIHSSYFDIKGKVESTNRSMISKSSYYERVKLRRSLKTIGAAQGHKVAYQLEPSYWMLNVDTPVHCERALELVHFDSTLLDVELRSSISGDVMGKPWLSIAVCAHTRRVVGMYLSFQPPSYVSTMMLLADIVRRHRRLPDAIIHDWGSEFKAKDWKYALTALFIVRHTRPKSAPRFGSVLERIFGIVTRELIDNIAGNTKIRKNVRQITPQSDPSTHSGLWMADLYQGLEEYFFDTYDVRKHPTTLRPPRALYESSLLAHGVRPHRMRQLDDILSIILPTARGRPRVVDPARGIYVNYRYYGHPLLTDLSLAGSTIVVKPIPFNPGSVLAFLKGNWVVCKTGLHEDLRNAPELVRRCLFEEWIIEQRLALASHDDSRMKVRELINRLNQKALDNKDYWNDREASDFMSVGTFAPLILNPATSTALSRLDEMMKGAIAAASEFRTSNMDAP